MRYPAQVFLILASQACERYSFYAVSTVLFMYLTTMYHMDEDDATAVYHTFMVLGFLTAILGAIVADVFLGRYKTILIMSLIYSIGTIILAVTSLPFLSSSTSVAGPLVGAMLIAFAAGAMKPCVYAFG